jgi:hypothetical protein
MNVLLHWLLFRGVDLWLHGRAPVNPKQPRLRSMLLIVHAVFAWRAASLAALDSSGTNHLLCLLGNNASSKLTDVEGAAGSVHCRNACRRARQAQAVHSCCMSQCRFSPAAPCHASLRTPRISQEREHAIHSFGLCCADGCACNVMQQL